MKQDKWNQQIEKYASIIMDIGIQLQKGQTLVISASLCSADFVRRISKIAYQRGAHYVYVNWHDDELSRIELLHRPFESLQHVQPWIVKGFEEMADEGAAFLYIISPYTHDLTGMDEERIAIVEEANDIAFEHFHHRMTSMEVSWCVAAVANEGWARKVFPHIETEQALSLLWEQLFTVAKVNHFQPEVAWEQHLSGLTKKAEWLNEQGFRYLHYKSEKTSLTIELPDSHLWINGLATNKRGYPFVCNIPTEEVYTTPLKKGVNGIVYGTKPFYYGGVLIADFSFTFKEGEIVDYNAKQGLEMLRKIIQNDEGARYIGEVALVPHHSPISMSDLLFYHPLFDENASSHIALGHAYTSGLRDGHTISNDQFESYGINNSFIHLDVMIGSEDLNIVGERKDGSLQSIFQNGNWIEGI